MIRATNRAYQVKESRPYWRRCLLALGLTVFAGAALTSAFVLQVAGCGHRGLPDPAGWPGGGVRGGAGHRPLARRPRPARPGRCARVPGGANVELPWRWVSPGAAVFVAGWLLTTFGFSVYVTVFGDYSETYGALAGVAVLLIWFYLTAYVVLCDAELNAYLDRRLVTARETQPEGGRAGGHHGTGGPFWPGWPGEKPHRRRGRCPRGTRDARPAPASPPPAPEPGSRARRRLVARAVLRSGVTAACSSRSTRWCRSRSATRRHRPPAGPGGRAPRPGARRAGRLDRAANHPDLRAIEALVAAVTGFLVLFALLYLGLAQTDPANFTQPLGRVSALYFTATVLATVGFGDITAQTDGARLLVTVQMLLGLGLVAGLVRVFSAAARAGAARAPDDRPPARR